MYPLYIMENCIACGVCAKVCKNDAISMDVEVKFDGRRFLRSYSIDYSKCDSCMECVKKCRMKSIIEVEGEKPEGEFDLFSLINLKRKLNLTSKKKSQFVDECIGCLLCVVTCPLNAVSYEDSNGIRTIEIDRSICEGCGMCVRNCPNYALSLKEV